MIFKEFLRKLRELIDEYEPLFEDRCWLDKEHTLRNHNHVRPPLIVLDLNQIRNWAINNYEFYVRCNFESERTRLKEVDTK